MRSLKKKELLDIDDILSLSWSWRPSMLMLQAHNAGIFDAIAGGPKSADEIAAILNFDPRSTLLVLLGLSGVGLLEKSGQTFNNIEVIEKHFIKSSDDYKGNIFELDHRALANWMRIPEIVESGEPIPKPERTPDETKAWHEIFIKAMDDIAHRFSKRMFEALPLKDGMEILDIGCGPATYMIEFCKRMKNLSSVCFDKPQSEHIVNDFAHKAGVGERIKFIGGDLTKSQFSFGSLFDGILISQVLHIFGEEEAKSLLKKAEMVLAPGGFIAIHEMTLGPDKDPGPAAVFAIQMMLGTKQGSVYSKDTIKGWFKDLGMSWEKAIRIDQRSEVMIGRKSASPNQAKTTKPNPYTF